MNKETVLLKNALESLAGMEPWINDAEMKNRFIEKVYGTIEKVDHIIASTQSENREKEEKPSYNTIAPKSSKIELSSYDRLRKPDSTRDENYSPLFDSIMGAVCDTLKTHTDPEIFQKAWTSSMFPERISKRILRLVEEYTGATQHLKEAESKDIESNMIENLKDEIECVHLKLDELGIQRSDDKGVFSINGRITNLVKAFHKQESELESHYLSSLSNIEEGEKQNEALKIIQQKLMDLIAYDRIPDAACPDINDLIDIAHEALKK